MFVNTFTKYGIYDIDTSLSVAQQIWEGPDPDSLTDQDIARINSLAEEFGKLTQTFQMQKGTTLSIAEREAKNITANKTLTYGEVDFMSVAELIFLCANRYGLKANSTFWDLGHG